MLILFLTRRYLPHIGGVETHLERISAILVKQKHRVMIVTEQDDPRELLHEIVDGVEVWRIANPSKLKIWLWLLQHVNLFFAANVVHIHDVFFWILPFYPLFMAKKLTITFHGYEAPGPLTKRQIFWHWLASKMCEANICIGDFHKKWYHVKPTVVSYGGVDAVVPAKKRLNDAAIFVGRLESDTGISAYLEALKIADHKIHLDVYGDGSLKNAAANVTFHGFVKDATQHFPKYEVVFASQYLSILQALAAGCTVIAFADTPIKKDYLEMTPFAQWITIAKTPAEIAAALSAPAAPSPDAIAWAQSQTWQKLTDQYLDLWERQDV